MFILKNKNNIIQTDLYYDLFMKYENKKVINEVLRRNIIHCNRLNM